jgi:hypothetical protein
VACIAWLFLEFGPRTSEDRKVLLARMSFLAGRKKILFDRSVVGRGLMGNAYLKICGIERAAHEVPDALKRLRSEKVLYIRVYLAQLENRSLPR